MQRGATAVIFDVSENPEAIDQVGPPGHADAVPSLGEALPLVSLTGHGHAALSQGLCPYLLTLDVLDIGLQGKCVERG